MPDFILTYATETWILLNEAAPWVLFGFFMAALIKIFVSDQFIAKHLGGRGPASVLKASALGVPLPLCSCGVVPAATGLRRQGAGKGATAAFMISTPETGADSMAVTWAMLDPVMTVVRPVAAFISATLAGLAIDALDPDTGKAAPQAQPTSLQSTSCGCGGGCCSGEAQENHQSFSHRLREGFAQTFGEMLQDIGKWLLIGILLAGAISAFVPQDFFERFLGNEWASLVVMLAAGIPLYICATSSTPIAATMALKGLSPGAALVFLLAGPATNAATIAVTAKVLGRRAAAIYVGSIAICAVGLGWLVNRIYFGLGLSVTSWVRASESDHVTWWSMAASVLLLGLILVPMLRRGQGHGCGCGCESSHQHAHASACACSSHAQEPLKPLNSKDFKIR